MTIPATKINKHFFANGEREIKVYSAFSDVTIASGQAAESDIIDLKWLQINGSMTLQLELTGSGTAKIEALTSIDGISYIKASGQGYITSSFNATGGEDSNGKDILPVEIYLARYLKLLITEIGSSEIVVNGILAAE